MPTLEQSLPSDVVRPLLAAYDTDNLQFQKRQLFFDKIAEGQDSLLFETVTVYSPAAKTQGAKLSKADLIKPDRIPCVILHHSFPIYWDVMQDDQKDNSICHRAFWLGEAWNEPTINPEKVSSFLVTSLAERVKRFKANVNMSYLTPYDGAVHAKYPHVYENAIDYQDWFYSLKGQSKYDWNVVNAFAKGEKVAPITGEFAFCYQTPVLTAEEIELVYEELKKNPKPKLEPSRPRKLDNNSSDRLEKLTDAVTKLAEIQINQTTDKVKGTK